MATIIIPAHNEAHVIGRLLRPLVADAEPDELDIIVVANACDDDTARLAESFGPPVRVISIPVASKHEALLTGDCAAADFPRLYIDADVELRLHDVRELIRELHRPGILATGPERAIVLEGRPRLVRWHYEIWAQLPSVRDGLFGRGVIGLTEEGHARVAGLPVLMADDLAAALSFAQSERSIVQSATAVIHAPRTFPDFLRRRVRAAQGIAQVEGVPGAPASTARTSARDLLEIVCRRPRSALKVALFLMIAILVRLRARRLIASGDFETWLRDESSRANPYTAEQGQG